MNNDEVTAELKSCGITDGDLVREILSFPNREWWAKDGMSSMWNDVRMGHILIRQIAKSVAEIREALK